MVRDGYWHGQLIIISFTHQKTDSSSWIECRLCLLALAFEVASYLDLLVSLRHRSSSSVASKFLAI